ncbi:MAG TPA: energy transducer TonB [Opitutaceae bacterium]|nr:energy transducer TonB [Opitutaceae bacterium]
MKTPVLLLMLVAMATAPAAFAVEAASAARADYVPCKIHQTTHATFPLRLLRRGVTQGQATLVLELDPTGRIADKLVIQYTHRELADEAERTVETWTFEPGRVKGEPAVSIVSITFDFTVEGIVVYEKHPDSALEEAFAAQLPYFAHGADTLDQRLTAVETPSPIYPQTWIEAGRAGSVTIRFFIDESGRARLPAVIHSGDMWLASAARAAVKQWRFAPPRHHGQPVLAQAEQVFVFAPAAKVETKS